MNKLPVFYTYPPIYYDYLQSLEQKRNIIENQTRLEVFA